LTFLCVPLFAVTMKFFPLLAVGACANQAAFMADPNDAMNQLSMLMAGSQASLGKAQRHHQKLVDKMRKEVDKNFGEEADAFGESIGKYAVELAQAEDVLKQSIDAGVAVLIEEAKVPVKADDWEDPGVAERARLNAQLNAANRTLQHMGRAHDRAMHEAEDDSSQAFEDAGMKLSMRLGDLTDNSENAKKRLSAKAESMRASFSATKTKLFVAQGKDQQTRLGKYEQELKESQLKSSKAAETAKKGFAAFLAKENKVVEKAGDVILDELAKGQQMEIDKVLKHQPTLAPLKKKADKKADADQERRAAEHKHLKGHPEEARTVTTTAAQKKLVEHVQATTTTTQKAVTTKTSKQDAAAKASQHKNQKKK